MLTGRIRKFTVHGVARDQSWIVNNQLLIETYVHEEMLAKGFLPVLDRQSELRWSYNEEDDTFNYTITIECLKVGRRKSKKFRGVVLNQGLLIDMEGGTELLRTA